MNSDPSSPLDQSFAALATYSDGSSRGALLAIDDAVIRSLAHPPERIPLEARLLQTLQSDAPRPAREYICLKLELIGSDASVAALGQLLSHADLADVACRALQTIPGSRASQALREHLDHLRGVPLLAVIDAVGSRRDAESTAPLQRLLKSTEPSVSTAAAAALGRIGTPGAGHALGQQLDRPGAVPAAALADACLACAEALEAAGQADDARALREAVRRSVPAGSPAGKARR